MSDLPMPKPTIPNKPLPSFKLLSFDIYGTLIDWETGIVQRLQPLVAQSPLSPNPYANLDTDPRSRTALAALFNDIEHEIQRRTPSLPYPILLSQVHHQIATSHLSIPSSPALQSQSDAFGASVGTWSPFPDTIDAMIRLSRHYKLVPLSNVDKASFNTTRSHALQGKVDFWRVFTAEDIGSYKPDLRNFEYLIRKADEECRAERGREGEGDGEGIKREEILHVAQSLFHDHVPAKEMGMR